MNPREIKSYLDKYVVKHASAKNVLSTALYMHNVKCKLPDVELPSATTLVIGDTGTGKSYMIQRLAEMWGGIVHTIDCSQLTPEGYKGYNMSESMSLMYTQATAHMQKQAPKMELNPQQPVLDYYSVMKHTSETSNSNLDTVDKVLAHSVIVLDEIDKLSGKNSSSNVGEFKGQVQRELLRMLNGDPYVLEVRNSSRSIHVEIPTRRMLIFLSGAFVGIRELMQERSKVAGFSGDTEIKKKDIEPLLETYGLIPEFIGRIQNIVFLDALEEPDYFDILTKVRSSVVEKYIDLFQHADVTLKFTEGAYRELAHQASISITGARSLEKLMAKILLPLLYQLAESGSTLIIGDDLTANVIAPQKLLSDVI